MQKPSILHVLTAAKNVSPFDVNMAIDAGFEHIIPYTDVALSEVAGLTQDAIFSRSPSGIQREALFIGGRDIDLAMQMLTTAKSAMFAPFACSVMADPSGAFTTAAAMVAKLEHHLQVKLGTDLSGKTLSVFGATGPVGGCAAMIAAQCGAQVQLVAHNSIARIETKIADWQSRYQVQLTVVDGTDEDKKTAILQQSDLVISAAAAGVQVLSTAQIAAAQHLKIIADVNAVAPYGVEGLEPNCDGSLIAGTHIAGVGALAIGQLKYATQHQLLKQLLPAAGEKPKYLEFMAAFHLARALLNRPS